MASFDTQSFPNCNIFMFELECSCINKPWNLPLIYICVPCCSDSAAGNADHFNESTVDDNFT